MSDVSTMTVPRRSWRIRDAVLRLRERGTTDRVYGLPVPAVVCRMGIASDLQLQLRDPSGSVSREHAELVPIELDGGTIWKVNDLKSKNGLCSDGERLRACVLRPGLEVRLGELRLIAESMELVGLLSVLRRCLGWAVDRQEHVDQALQSLRAWAAQRTELIIVGDGNLCPVVRRWHNLVIGAEVPFAWYEPADGVTDAAAVVKAAAMGTLCVATKKHQAEAMVVVEHVHGTEYAARPQLVLCTADLTSAATLKGGLDRPAVIQVPPLTSRVSELEDLVRDYAWEIAREQRLAKPELQDLEQLGMWTHQRVEDKRLGDYSLAEIEEDALKLGMLRTWGLRPGAARLGMTHSSLSSWAHHRGLKPS
jgi:hypothetical protein